MASPNGLDDDSSGSTSLYAHAAASMNESRMACWRAGVGFASRHETAPLMRPVAETDGGWRVIGGITVNLVSSWIVDGTSKWHAGYGATEKLSVMWSSVSARTLMRFMLGCASSSKVMVSHGAAGGCSTLRTLTAQMLESTLTSPRTVRLCLYRRTRTTLNCRMTQYGTCANSEIAVVVFARNIVFESSCEPARYTVLSRDEQLKLLVLEAETVAGGVGLREIPLRLIVILCVLLASPAVSEPLSFCEGVTGAELVRVSVVVELTLGVEALLDRVALRAVTVFENLVVGLRVKDAEPTEFVLLTLAVLMRLAVLLLLSSPRLPEVLADSSDEVDFEGERAVLDFEREGCDRDREEIGVALSDTESVRLHVGMLLPK